MGGNRLEGKKFPPNLDSSNPPRVNPALAHLAQSLGQSSGLESSGWSGSMEISWASTMNLEESGASNGPEAQTSEASKPETFKIPEPDQSMSASMHNLYKYLFDQSLGKFSFFGFELEFV